MDQFCGKIQIQIESSIHYRTDIERHWEEIFALRALGVQVKLVLLPVIAQMHDIIGGEIGS
jgi:hypothetical protein